VKNGIIQLGNNTGGSFMIDQALLCLAQTIYMESSVEQKEAQIGVGYVLMRRADFDPKQVCNEMRKPYQFSWYGKVKPPEHKEINPYFLDLAWRIMHKLEPDYSKGATNFHDNSISKPQSWFKLKKTVQWSHMIFYKMEETKYAQY
jgi:spore germination cell wall hydrolase CwlJ-like protein